MLRQIMLYQRGIVVPDDESGIVQSRHQIFLDIANPGGILFHICRDVLDMGTVQFQEPELDHLRRKIVADNADIFRAGTDCIQNSFRNFV